jgi:chemotaxis protein methyltransferase CheR
VIAMNRHASSDPGLAAVANFVWERTGIVFPAARLGDLKTGARKIMAKCEIVDMPEFLQCLQADTGLLDELVAKITVGETYFFREPGQFAYIRDEIAPGLRRLRGAEHVLRVWSAGCASGEEAYSLAILFEELGLANQTRILATDISRAALASARAAIYGAWSLRNEGARLAGPHLRSVGGRFQLAERFRGRVTFAYLNLAQDAYPTFPTNTWGMDLILCRNVLIYLDAETVRDVARRFHAALATGGYLIAGPSDPLLSNHAPFETLATPVGLIYYKPGTSNGTETVATPMASPCTINALPESPQPVALAPVPFVEQREPALIDPLIEAREALARGDNARVVELTNSLSANETEAALCVRALANLGDAESAAAKAAEAVDRHPRSMELGFLHAVLLLNLERYTDAERVLKRLLYLDRSLAVAQFTLGTTLHRLGNLDGAARAYRNARDLAAGLPPDEILALSDGERAARLAEAAAAHAKILEPLAGIQ